MKRGISTLNLARELKKTMEHEDDNYTNCDWCFGHSNLRIAKGIGGTWKLVDEWRPSKQQHNWERPEYWEESWRIEETCCQSNSCERPSANEDVKNSNWVDNNNDNAHNTKNTFIDNTTRKQKKKIGRKKLYGYFMWGASEIWHLKI